MGWLIGIVSITVVCASVGLLLFVLMHLMAASQQTLPRDQALAEWQDSKEHP